MKVTIIGTGYVGLVTGACLADVGNEVFCVDINAERIRTLNKGEVPLYEPGLNEIIERNRCAGRLIFSTDIEASVLHGEIQIIAVGTPPDEDGSADLQYVLEAARNIGRYMCGFTVVVDKSTVPVGTADRVATVLREQLAARDVSCKFSVVSNPEFLKEGAAVDDFTRPDRIVIGSRANEDGERAKDLMRLLYKPFNRNHERTLYMDVGSAEFTKYAANAMLATRISFMNEMANLAESVGADIESVRRGIGADPRIGYSFLYAGVGYGGSCFPKDVIALIKTAREHSNPARILEAVQTANERQRGVLLEKIIKRFGDDLTGRAFALWGLAFKPNTDDMRDAPSRAVAYGLLKRGATVRAYDPVANKEARRAFNLDLQDEPDLGKRLSFADTQAEATEGADALVVITEWTVFKSPDFDALTKSLRLPIIFDGRNLYEPDVMGALGIEYHSIGRRSVGVRAE